MDQDEIIEAQLVPDPVVFRRPVRWRELMVVLGVVVLADVTLYRGYGFSGYALLFTGVPLLLLLGTPPLLHQSRCWRSMLVVGFLILGLAVKMVWCGFELHILLGLTLLGAFAVALSGTVPYMLEVIIFPSRLVLGGLLGLAAYLQSLRKPQWVVIRVGWLSILLPLAALLAFSVLFMLANPDLMHSFGARVEWIFTAIQDWVADFSPPALEIVFWCAMAWIAIGLLRPLLSHPLFQALEQRERETKPLQAGQALSPFYAAARNTLVAVLVLFAVYLVFEFQTLWFREFPSGFYYSGYAHQGAFWLTVALALATFVLSLIFRGTVLRDPRLKLLRLFAWLWSLENIFLAFAVYHRLQIYVGFNGMTRMRVVGILGISSVLVGFLLVLWKIARNRGFLWLMRRQLWTVSLAIYLYGVLPVDGIVMAYNVRRILAGDAAPSVQITEHAVSAEGVLLLSPLLDCEDASVREGMRAYLADRYERAEALQERHCAEGWTSFQCADYLLLQQLRARSDQLALYRDESVRRQVYESFRKYAYQWF